MTGKRLLVLLAAASALSIAAVACGGDDNKDVVRAPTAAPTSASAVATPSLPPPTAPAPSTAPTAAAPAPTTAAPLPPAPTPPPPAPPVAPAPVSLNVTISNFSYAPNPITVRAGQQLTLNVANQDSFPHTLSFTGGGGTGQISGGGRGTATFTRPAAGQVQFFCEIHGAARMSGTITILP